MILAALCGLVGTLLLSLGLFCFFRDRRHLPQFSEVGEGIVAGFTEADEEGFVRPHVRFTHGRETVIIIGDVGSNPPGYRVGQKVAVRYPPGRPRLAIIADFRHLHLFNVANIFFGTVSIGVAILLLYLQWRL
jgi:hypothetical protein